MDATTHMSLRIHDAAGHRPLFTAAEAEAIARERFGVDASAEPLPSERDLNFKLRLRDGGACVLKIASAQEERRTLELQNAALEHIASSAPELACPRVLRSVGGQPIVAVRAADDTAHLARLVSWIDGTPLADASPRSAEMLGDLGAKLGALDACLAGFSHPAARRVLAWDLRHAPSLIRQHIGAIEGAPRRALIERFLDRHDAKAGPRLDELRTGIIHNDANDHNVLVGPAVPRNREVVGLIDFGDMVESWIVAEPAVAAAYAGLGSADPVAAAGHVLAGYHEHYPLTDAEIAAFFPLLCLRLCLSVTLSAYQSAREPDQPYLAVSEAQAWSLLERLDAIHPRLAHYRLRAACGLDPCPAGTALAKWLREHGAEAAAVVEPDPRSATSLVFDFSVGSTEWAGEEIGHPMLAAEAIAERMRRADAVIAFGRYDEARLVYTSEQFIAEGDAGSAFRTVHIGVDVFQPAGAAVFAPLDGTVHSLADNARPLDYGPTVILEHSPANGPRFWTLYGHLSRESLVALREGQVVRAGERIAAIGNARENGGWAPHLHFQILADTLDKHGDFPGVAPADERDVWCGICPDPNLLLGVATAALRAERPSTARLREERRLRIGPSLSLSYRRPLEIVCGRGTWLYDAEGRAFLDCVNNVCHVGHAHPRVVDAAYRQMATLNTNTRYLHENLVRYADRLTALLPEPLSVCYFVNSGSEANDLALRLARAHTGRCDTIVVDGAYHGNLTSLIEISPYKFDGPGGAGAPARVHAVVMPDPYRGPYRGHGPETGARYAGAVRDAVERAKREHDGVAAFIAESLLGCGGQIVLPEGYLAAAYAHVRAAGGICIADEVQVGFGRVGTHVWGFETRGVVPDIVTLGKPIGNGHPLGAVVTTPEIAASFANGMEYFNTFGGNPVSCAVGLAVLDVMRDEGLQARALRVGRVLEAGLRTLMDRHALIGDVRGRGLFLGLELVRDRETLEPAAEQAAYVVERARELGVLLSTDGPLHNVIKIKPPLVFGEAEAERLVGTLDTVLGEDFARA